MDEYGWLFYPKECVTGECKLNVILHDCGMNALDMIQPEYGWPQIAQANKIILLFP